jgi:cyclophilin family peptidyl-prolyl cis-trans isomerase
VAADSTARTGALDSLRAHLTDADAATRGMCARALLLRLGPAAFDAARPVLEDRDVYARTGALPGVAGLKRADATAYLMPLLDPRVPLIVRMSAADQLGTIKARSAIPQLRAGLADSASLYVAAAAGALESLEDFDSAPMLMKAYAKHVTDADADARIGIRDALRTLAGHAVADSVERAHPIKQPHVAYPVDFGHPSKVRGAVIHTGAGDVEIEFYRVEAVQTVKNFVALAQRGYFDGSAFHRVVPNFVIQDGDPTGTGAGGPGYTIRCEYNRLRYEPGMVGMALSGKDTGGSQWFITHSPQPHLNGKYTIFARVVRGMDVVGRITQGTKITKIDLVAGT